MTPPIRPGDRLVCLRAGPELWTLMLTRGPRTVAATAKTWSHALVLVLGRILK